MKILFFFGKIFHPYRHYVYNLYKEHLENQGHIVDKCLCIQKHHQVDKEFIGFTSWEKLTPQQYDIILIIDIPGRKTMLPRFFEPLFEIRKRPIYYLKGSFQTEMPILNHPLIHIGYPSDFYLKFRHYHMPDPQTKNKFQFPFLSKILPKKNQLSKENFYKKYHLNPNQKICAFFPGSLNRTHCSNKNFYLNLGKQKANNLAKYWNHVVKEFENHGFQIVGKTKFDEKPKCKEAKIAVNILKKIPLIDENDLPELLFYSKLAMTTSTTMTYELYCYNLPCLDFGFGYYFFQWINTRYPHKFSYNNQLINRFKNHELVFGKVVDLESTENAKKITQTVRDFINTNWKIENFPYRNNHPMFGNTYDNTVETICQQIISLGKTELCL